MITQPAWIHKSMVVKAAIVEMVRMLTDSFGEASQNMFRTPLAPKGAAEPTHYISAGMIDEKFALMISSPEELVKGAAEYGHELTMEQAIYILDNAEISDLQGLDHLAELELELWHSTDEGIIG